MVDVYLFNPEHDLALAHGAHNYTAPPFARQFRHDMRLLPAWLATAGSYITVPDDAPIEEDRRCLQDHHLDLNPIAISQIASLGACRIHPWDGMPPCATGCCRQGYHPSSCPPMSSWTGFDSCHIAALRFLFIRH
jgi:hypothetical protein